MAQKQKVRLGITYKYYSSVLRGHESSAEGNCDWINIISVLQFQIICSLRGSGLYTLSLLRFSKEVSALARWSSGYLKCKYQYKEREREFGKWQIKEEGELERQHPDDVSVLKRYSLEIDFFLGKKLILKKSEKERILK